MEHNRLPVPGFLDVDLHHVVPVSGRQPDCGQGVLRRAGCDHAALVSNQQWLPVSEASVVPHIDHLSVRVGFHSLILHNDS